MRSASHIAGPVASFFIRMLIPVEAHGGTFYLNPDHVSSIIEQEEGVAQITLTSGQVFFVNGSAASWVEKIAGAPPKEPDGLAVAEVRPSNKQPQVKLRSK